MRASLLIIAAGMGSRYGGLKQIDAVGPNGEIIIDYSMYDAVTENEGQMLTLVEKYC